MIGACAATGFDTVSSERNGQSPASDRRLYFPARAATEALAGFTSSCDVVSEMTAEGHPDENPKQGFRTLRSENSMSAI